MAGRCDDLTVLLVAEGERLAPALRERLETYDLSVVECALAKVVDTAYVVAPDLIVLAGDAARDGGIEILAMLAASLQTASMPVAVVGDVADPRGKSTSFRHGIVAMIERTASADEFARRIAQVARELPERTGEARGALGVGGAAELVDLLAESLRTGILSMTGPDGTTARVVLRADRPATEVIEQLLERLRPLAAERGAVQYEFHETLTGRLGTLDLGTDDDARELSHLSRDRLLLIEQNPARADLLAQGLRAHGARVAVADGVGHGLALAREMAPDVVIVDSSAMDGWALEALRMIRRDPWLRWASLLLVESGRLWREERRPDIVMLSASIDALVRADRDLTRRVASESTVGTRLEVIGPLRTLRALADTKLGLRVSVHHARVVIDIDLSDGLIAGASARLPQRDAPIAEGPAALATLFAISSGRVQIERAQAPRSTNVMAMVDDAIGVAAREEPAISPSLLPPSLLPVAAPVAAPVPPDAPLPRDVVGLVGQLEQLLGEFRARTHEPPGAPAEATPPPTDDEPPPLAGEPTGRFQMAEVATLRRRMRESSQHLRAVGGAASSPSTAAAAPPDAAAPAPAPAVVAPPAPAAPVVAPPAPAAPVVAPPAPAAPVAGAPRLPVRPPLSRKPTLVFASAPIASTRRAANESGGAAEAIPAPVAALPASPKSATVSGVELIAPAAAPAIARPPPTIPTAPSPSTATRLPASGGDVPRSPGASLPRAPHAAPVDRASPPASTVARPPEPSAPPPVGSAPSVASVVIDEAALASPPARAQPPALAPSMAAPLAAPLPAPEPPVAPPLAAPPPPVEPREMPALSAPASSPPRRVLAIALAVSSAVILIVLLIVGVAHVVAPAPAPLAVTLPPEVVEPITPPEVARPVVPPEVARPVISPPDAPARPATTAMLATGPYGPGPGEPLEGSDADLDFDAIRARHPPPPAGRRARSALVRRLLGQATTARQHDRIDEAMQRFEQVISIERANGRATAGLSYVHADRGEPREALAWAQRLVRVRPELASHWVLLGDVLRAGGNLGAARRAYERATATQPGFTLALRRLRSLGAQSP